MKQICIQRGDASLDIEKCACLLSDCFGEGRLEIKNKFINVISNEPTPPQDSFLLAKHKGEIVGLLRMMSRKLVVGQTVINCGGFSSVAVAPQFRGQFVAPRLLSALDEYMKSQAAVILLGHGRSTMDACYVRSGFFGINRYHDVELLPDGLPDMSEEIFEFVKFLLEDGKDRYRSVYSALSGSMIRGDGEWKFLLAKIAYSGGADRICGIVDKRNNSYVGYAIFFGPQLVELALDDKYYPYMPKALAALKITRTSIHPHHPFHRYLRTKRTSILRERLALTGGYVGKLLNVESFLSSLAEDYKKRVGDSYGTLVILGHEVSLENGIVCTSDRAPDVNAGCDVLLRLMLGVHAPSDFWGVSWNEDKPWLKFFFPDRGFHTSKADEF